MSLLFVPLGGWVVKQFLLSSFLIIFIVLLQMSVVGVLLSGFYLHEFLLY